MIHFLPLLGEESVFSVLLSIKLVEMSVVVGVGGGGTDREELVVSL